jgi:hypothetical protein
MRIDVAAEGACDRKKRATAAVAEFVSARVRHSTFAAIDDFRFLGKLFHRKASR